MLVQDNSKQGSAYLNLYTRPDLPRVLSLFNRARKDGRLLRFLCAGPEASAAVEAIRDLLEGPPPGPWEPVAGIYLWGKASYLGVRRKAAERTEDVDADLTPIFQLLSKPTSSWEPVVLPNMWDVDALAAKLLRERKSEKSRPLRVEFS